jgi:hypothetical protein
MLFSLVARRQLLALLLLSSSRICSSQFSEEDGQVPLNPGLDQTLDHIDFTGYVEPSNTRHVEEKKRLLATYERTDETWTVNHPRYRMLQALHGFVRYQERYQTQVQEWKDAYEALPEEQKQVC